MPSRACRELRDDAVGEPLPALARMRGGRARGDGEHAVSRSTPRSAQGVRSPELGMRQAEVGAELGEDVAKRRRRRDACRNREAQPHRLAAAVVGVLAEDHDAHGVERRQPQRVEDEAAGREEAAAGRDLGREERPQLAASAGSRARRRRPRASSRPSAASRSHPSRAGLDHTIAAAARAPHVGCSRYASAAKSERGPGGTTPPSPVRRRVRGGV